jgi:16S rRNA (uracil1498-N3)-methyltransferase
MMLMDGNGTFYRACVTMTTPKRCLYDIVERMPQKPQWTGRVHLAIAPTKLMDRMEWLVEKATEVGFDELSFLDCQFSERRQLREDRIEKIVVSAMKQSRKPWLPVVNAMMPFEKFIQTSRQGRQFIAHCYDEIERKDFFTELSASPADDVTILVGPEGDFSINEVQMAMDRGFVPVTLGKSRLRTETAGLSAVMMAQLTHRKC